MFHLSHCCVMTNGHLLESLCVCMRVCVREKEREYCIHAKQFIVRNERLIAYGRVSVGIDRWKFKVDNMLLSIKRQFCDFSLVRCIALICVIGVGPASE